METNTGNDSVGGGIERFIARNWPYVIIGVVGFWFWGTISSFVVSALEDALMAGLLIVGGVLGVGILTSKKFHLLAQAAYGALTGRAVDSIVDFMPVQIMDAQIESLKELVQGKISEAVANFSGHVESIREIIRTRTAEYNKYMQGASAAKAQLETSAPGTTRITQEDLNSLMSKASSLKEMIDGTTVSLEFFESQLEVLIEAKKNCLRRIEEAVFQRNLIVTKYNLAIQGARVLKLSRSALNMTSSPQYILLNKAAESMANKYTNYVGQMNNFMDESRSMIVGYEMDDLASAERGKVLLAQFQEKQRLIESGVAGITLEKEKAAIEGGKQASNDAKVVATVQTKSSKGADENPRYFSDDN